MLDNVFRLAHLYTKTKFIFRHADTFAVDLDTTDLLLIDSGCDGIRLGKQLEKHATAVRRRIVARNTAGIRSVTAAIESFLSSHEQWELLPDHSQDNDLTILKRRV